MSQRLTTRYRKDGNAKGVAIRKNRSTTPKILKTLFRMAYHDNIKKHGKGKN